MNLYVCMCALVTLYRPCAHICFRSSEVVRPEAGIQALGNQPAFSARTPGAHDHWAICPAPQLPFDIQNRMLLLNLENPVCKWIQFKLLTSRRKLKIIRKENTCGYFLDPKAATMAFSCYELLLVFFSCVNYFILGT